jgi:hypothetical protein
LRQSTFFLRQIKVGVHRFATLRLLIDLRDMHHEQ